MDLCFSPPRELSQRFVEKPQPSVLVEDCEIVEHWVGLRNGACDGGRIKKDGEAKEVEKLKVRVLLYDFLLFCFSRFF